MPHVTPLRPDEPRRIGRYRLTGRADGLTAAYENPPGVFTGQRPDGGTVLVTLFGDVPAGDHASRDRFIAEARAARRVPPFCTARILDSGIEGTLPYLVTEFVPGPSLAEVVGAEGPLATDTVQAVAAGCATALAAIHQAGLVHGHLRPEVVVLSPEGLRVVQFSIIPPYGSATPAADMLGWAHMVLFAAAGHLPGVQEDLARLPDDLRPVVAACISPDPAGRPGARAVLSELLSRHDLSAGLLAEGSRLAAAAARTPPSQAAQRIREPKAGGGGRSRVALWVAAFAVCLIAIVAAAAFISHRNSTPTASITMTPVPGSPAHSRTRSHPAVPTGFAGDWSGAVHQTNPDLTVTVDISLTKGSATGTVSYPGLDCSGGLTVVSATSGQLRLRQDIAKGQRSCEDGMITLTVQASGRLGYTFHRSGGGSPPTGILARRTSGG